MAADLPDDIAAEKRTSAYLRHTYKNALFGGLRNFRALRQQAPGIIAEFTLAASITAAMLVVLFRDVNVSGVLQTAGFCIYFVAVVGVCFWVAGRIWRAVGLSVRNCCRYVVRNIWTLAVTGLVAVSAFLKLMYPDWDSSTQTASGQATVPVAATVEGSGSLQLPGPEVSLRERIFVGPDWKILHDSEFRYARARVEEAPGRCEAMGEDWLLAERSDYEDLAPELMDAGHVGSFWVDSERSDFNLGYVLNADGTSHFHSTPAGRDMERAILCVTAIVD